MKMELWPSSKCLSQLLKIFVIWVIVTQFVLKNLSGYLQTFFGFAFVIHFVVHFTHVANRHGRKLVMVGAVKTPVDLQSMVKIFESLALIP